MIIEDSVGSSDPGVNGTLVPHGAKGATSMARDIVRRNETLPAAAPSGLPVDQERAIAALLKGESVTAAAGRVGVSRQTVHRSLAEDPDFIAAYNQARREIAEAVNQCSGCCRSSPSGS